MAMRPGRLTRRPVIGHPVVRAQSGTTPRPSSQGPSIGVAPVAPSLRHLRCPRTWLVIPATATTSSDDCPASDNTQRGVAPRPCRTALPFGVSENSGLLILGG